MKDVDMEYANYVVNPYGWVTKATIEDLMWLKSITKDGSDVQKRKGREMMRQVVRQLKFKKDMAWFANERMAVAC